MRGGSSVRSGAGSSSRSHLVPRVVLLALAFFIATRFLSLHSLLSIRDSTDVPGPQVLASGGNCGVVFGTWCKKKHPKDKVNGELIGGLFRTGRVRPPFRDEFQDGGRDKWFGRDTPVRGMLFYVNGWAQWNNHRRQLLDAIAVAREMNRVLVVPAFHAGHRRPSLWSFFDARELRKLGPIIGEEELFDPKGSRALAERYPWFKPVVNMDERYECAAITPSMWGASVRDHGLKHIAKRRMKVTSVRDYPIKSLYGGVWNTAEWSRLYGQGVAPIGDEQIICATYLFSMNRFEGEKSLFAHIRRHMRLRSEFSSVANQVVERLKAKTRGLAYVTAHVRRGDHEGFCRAKLPETLRRDPKQRGPVGCYPTVEEMAERLRAVTRSTGASLVYLAHNAKADEIAALGLRGVKVATFDSIHAESPVKGVDAMYALLDGDKRANMIVDVLVAATGGVFVGNNWSTLTGCILEERAAAGYDPGSFVYWANGGENTELWYGREGEKDPQTCLCGEISTAKELPYDWLALP